MARLRYNNAVGSLGAILSPTATTITFKLPPPFATIVAPDYIPLVLDPIYGSSTPSTSFEVVWLTSYTAGSQVGTIERAQEGTTASSHDYGAVWVNGPTTYDLGSVSVQIETSASAIQMDGAASAGTTTLVADAGHVHPTDTSRAPLASPAFTGTPTAPTAAALANSTQISTTAYTDAAVGVEKSRATSAEALLAPIASPTFTGTPTAPTPAIGDSSGKLATTHLLNQTLTGKTTNVILTPSGGDDTPQINAAIKTVFSAGGGEILFTDGVYLINGALQTTDQFGNAGYRSQITIPMNASSNPKTVITLKGANSGDHGSGFGSGAPSQQGALLLSNSAGATWDGSTTPAIIGGPNQTTGFTNVGVTLENLHIRTPSNPNIAGVQAGWIMSLELDGVTFDTTDAFPTAAEPTNPSGVAVIMPQNYCDNANIRHVYIFAYYVGIVTGEHNSGDDILIQHCYIGLSPQGAYHGNHFGYICMQECPYQIAGWSPSTGVEVIPSTTPLPALDIDYCDFEDNRTVSNWAELKYHVYGAANLVGRIRYHMVTGDVGQRFSAWTTDAASNSLVGIPDPVVIRASRAGLASGDALTTTAGTSTLSLDTIISDPNTHFASGSYVCPANGDYSVSGAVGATSTGATQYIQCVLMHSGVAYSSGSTVYSSAASQALGSSVTDVITAAAGDTIGLAVTSNTAGLAVADAAASTYLSVAPLSID